MSAAARRRTVKIAPSLLSADFADIADQIRMVESGGANELHLDSMDGVFVPNFTWGMKIVKDLRKLTRLPFDCHLMIVEPEKYVDAFREAGADVITFHYEATPHQHRLLRHLRSIGAKAGIAINPATPAESLSTAIEFCDFVLVMTVNPGFGGQRFIEPVVPKIRHISRLIRERGLPVEIEVDGGVDPKTAPAVVAAGASILVAGSAVFGQKDRSAAMQAIRSAVTAQKV